MEKKDYISNIIQAANKVLEYEKLVNGLGGSIEELFWDIVVPESVEYDLAEKEEPLDGLDAALQRFRCTTIDKDVKVLTDIASLANSVSTDIYNLRQDIEHIKAMSSEDVLAIRSIMGQVELLRDTLIWSSNEHQLNRGQDR